MKKLSVITICLNEADSIERTLGSVAGQTFRDFEQILIDGGSTDGTLDIINQYRENIDKLVSEPDDGIYNAQNKGAALSGGEYLFFLNAGDYFFGGDALEKVFAQDPVEDFIYGDFVVRLNSGSSLLKKTPRNIRKTYMFVDSVPHQATFVKKTLFDEIGPYVESYKFAADYDFSLKALFEKKASRKKINVPVAVYNLRGATAGPANRREFMAERKKARKKYYTVMERMLLSATKPLWLVFEKYLRIFYFMAAGRINPPE